MRGLFSRLIVWYENSDHWHLDSGGSIIGQYSFEKFHKTPWDLFLLLEIWLSSLIPLTWGSFYFLLFVREVGATNPALSSLESL